MGYWVIGLYGALMERESKLIKPPFGKIKTADELGSLIRAFRQSKHFTLERVSGLTRLSMRFLSELERGKEAAELGKALSLLNKLGLEVIVQPRGYDAEKDLGLAEDDSDG